MAIFTGPAVDGDMRGRQASGYNAVVTADTGTPHCRVIDPTYAGPAHGGVAGFAAAVRSDVLRVLARRNGTVVTGAAIAGDVAVIEHRMSPIHSGMAVVALIVTRYVSGCLTL